MGKLVRLIINEIEVEVPEGTLIVNAAMKVGVQIPVFCYHPKLEPVGMCRMCLVEIGRPVLNRSTGELEREADGSLKIQFSPKLETACTTPVSEGMVVRGLNENVRLGRKDIIEFLLTSHPLDCPVCDKGGECPLQNLTLDWGPGKSRFQFSEKMHLAKKKPLGDLIFLDQERCIQCGRCVRFQSEIVDDPVIGFYQRGRRLQIMTNSHPGFASYFSGNTTDICPVGALTTADFRFQARPWEMNAGASICQQCAVGCNITVNVRRENKSNGAIVVKRIMPRQNESVNEIWICDKGRFAYHYAESPERVSQPLVRKEDRFEPVSWDEALDLAAEHLKKEKASLVTLVSGRLSNEDLYQLHRLSELLNGQALLDTHMAGGDLTAKVGVGKGTNFLNMGPETVILVVASDILEEAPLYFLRIKQAVDRGAKLIVLNPRQTKLDKYAAYVLRYPYGSEAYAVQAMINALSAKRTELPLQVKDLARSKTLDDAAKVFAEADNAIVIFGSEGTSLPSSMALSQASTNLLVITNHIGRENNGLIAVWTRPNEQGAWDMGFRPHTHLDQVFSSADVAYIAGADPIGDNPGLRKPLDHAGFIIVQELFMTETAKMADVILPAQSFIEREGTTTNAERRVQRYYPCVPPQSGSLPDFAITARIGARLGINLLDHHAAQVMDQICSDISDYSNINYQSLAIVDDQWPIIARSQLFYGGTTYENRQGLGIQLEPGSQKGELISLEIPQPYEPLNLADGDLIAFPIDVLYDRGQTMGFAPLLESHILEPYFLIHPNTAKEAGILDKNRVKLSISENTHELTAHLTQEIPQKVVLIPRSMGTFLQSPGIVKLVPSEPEHAEPERR